MEKATLLIISAFVLCLCSLSLPWIYHDSTAHGLQPVERAEYWFWSFMAKRTIYQTNYAPTTQYVLYHEFWMTWEIVPDIRRILIMFYIGDFSLHHLWEGYYIIFLFQILTVLFLFISLFIRIVAERWLSTFKQTALYLTTFLISIGAPIVGVNQYTRDWEFSGLGWVVEFVQFEIGFYLAVVSSILILAYVASYLVKVLRKKL